MPDSAPVSRRSFLLGGACLLVAGCGHTRTPQPTTSTASSPASSLPSSGPPTRRLPFTDHGVLLRHGTGPAGCDALGSREAIVFSDGTRYYLHYDGVGPSGWRACLATSEDGTSWELKGPVLGLGAPGRPDSASASSPWVIEHEGHWYMYYLGTPHAGRPPGRVPAPPYITCLAVADHPTGPWHKRYDVSPFTRRPGSFYAITASPGAVISHDGSFLQFFSGSASTPQGLRRTLGLARTTNLAGQWTVSPQPLLPLASDIENSSIYYEKADGGWWWLFTNHISERGSAHTDAAYAYWSRDPTSWNPAQSAIALDTTTCNWSKGVIGMPSVLPINGRLAMFYDGVQGSSLSHLGRDIAMASVPLPLLPPA